MTISTTRYATKELDIRETNISADSLVTQIGEVQVSPTTYTALDRLKTVAGNQWEGINRIGEIQASPTANTILARLKTLETNTAASATFDGVIDNTLVTQVYMKPTEFEISGEITRAANTTPYVANTIINGDGLSVLLELDFTGLGTVTSKPIQINSISLLSSYGAATIKLIPIVHLFQAATITDQTITDTTAFNPTYAITKSDDSSAFESLYTLVCHGAGCYKLSQTEIMRNCKLNASGKLYAIIIAGNAYTPASAEKITITVKGYLL